MLGRRADIAHEMEAGEIAMTMSARVVVGVLLALAGCQTVTPECDRSAPDKIRNGKCGVHGANMAPGRTKKKLPKPKKIPDGVIIPDDKKDNRGGGPGPEPGPGPGPGSGGGQTQV
jgi:hypothetical protein